MHAARRPLVRALAALFCLVPFTFAAPLEKPRIDVQDYNIKAQLVPGANRLTAKTIVSFTALDDISIATFELNNNLRLTRVLDSAGKAIVPERNTQDSTVRIALPAGLAKGQSTTLTFEYEGVLRNADESPIEGIKVAHVDPETSYLLYAGRWFPVSNYGVDRFTSTIEITVPTGEKVVGSGTVESGKPAAPGQVAFTFVSNTPSFPGTIIAGNFEETTTNENGIAVRTLFKSDKKAFAAPYTDVAGKELLYFSSLYGAAPANAISIVQLPDDTLPAAWAPGIAALAGSSISEKTNYRLLADVLAHQWWGVSVSPASRADFWITEGMSRYSEMRYVEQLAGQAAFQEATKDMATGALAYDTVPLASIGRQDPFSAQFQTLTMDKGGMIMHMLRWDIGDANFDRLVKNVATQYAGKSINTAQFQQATEQVSGEKMTAFFSQWLEGTGAPEFKNKYSVYRLGNGKGFRVTGQVTQDLDLFKMPVEVKVDTDGPSEMKRIEVVGTSSPYTIETFGQPRKITLDPNGWVLKSTPDLRVRVAILRGQQLVQEGDFAGALREYQNSLQANPNSSLAHYRIADVFFMQHNYQSAANEFREALNGDGEPRWTEVWSHLKLGQIFDTTGQRERAVNEYRQALQTNDNTQGALDEARKYLQKPFEQPSTSIGY